MNKDSFDSILDKYLANKCNFEERQLVEHWYDLVGNEANLPISDAAWESLKTKMWIEIQKEQQQTIVLVRPFYRQAFFRYGVAASLALFLGCVWHFGLLPATPKSFAQQAQQNKQLLVHNTTSQTKLLKLEDGSLVRLLPNAKLSYSPHFEGDKREVLLEGEAFFDVAKDSKKPFYVYANDLVTKVIGTSFFVRANKDSKQVQVLVQSGKVSVFRKEEITADNKVRSAEGMVILPNQQLNFDTQTAHFTKTIVEKPEVLSDQSSVRFNFEDASAHEVLQKIQTAYRINIIYDAEQLKGCPFTADLTTESLYGKISLLCQAIEASYQTIDGQIVISSKGCKAE